MIYNSNLPVQSDQTQMTAYNTSYGQHKRKVDTHLRVQQHLLQQEGAQESGSPSEEYPPLSEVVLVEERSPERSQLNVQA